MSTHQQEPQFFIATLTDVDANHHYCACFSFNEKVSITPSKPVDEEEENLGPGQAIIATTPTITHHNIMYAPKCLVLVSRLDYAETFKVNRSISFLKLKCNNLSFSAELLGYNIHCVFRKFAISSGNVNWKHIGVYPDSIAWRSTSSILHWSR